MEEINALPTIEDVLKKHLANFGEMTIEFKNKGDCDKFERAIIKAMQEWASLTPSNEKYGWVKASERLPKKDGQIVIKNPVEGHYALGYFSLEEESKESLFDEGDEWLDESTPIPLTPCGELEKEVERLKGLIKEGFILLQKEWKSSIGKAANNWEKFKTENNL